MCTVTYIPTAEGVILTSNRDERPDRTPILPPAAHRVGGRTLTFPVDPRAGGTWIAMTGGNAAGVLLNGGFEKHIPTPPYRESRGVILLEILSAPSPEARFRTLPLDRIEPFTLILVTGSKLLRCTWDGGEKHLQELDRHQSHIWSSATLYDRETRFAREQQLREWLSGGTPDQARILDFHQRPDIRYGATSRSGNRLETISTTSIRFGSGRPEMRYHDLPSGTVSTTFSEETPSELRSPFHTRVRQAIRRFLIKLRHWEYWPLPVLYFPVFLYHAWQSVKAGSAFYFSAANPSIETGGMFGESKSRILSRIPDHLKPVTLLFPPEVILAEVLVEILRHRLTYPLIAKPDIGERGWRVEKIAHEQDLKRYISTAATAFILQEYVDFPLEAGVFYYRYPGQERGTISSLVQKDFLCVTGNGVDSLETLITQNDRAFLQLPLLKKRIDLRSIPAAGEKVLLSPIGNHCLGTAFLDGSDLITDDLLRTFDTLSHSLGDFYFGRYDLRCPGPEDLRAGKNLKILELNGAGAEPAHIYHPGFSLAEGYRVLFHHWRTLYRISRENHRRGVPYLSLREAVFFWKKARNGRD